MKTTTTLLFLPALLAITEALPSKPSSSREEIPATAATPSHLTKNQLIIPSFSEDDALTLGSISSSSGDFIEGRRRSSESENDKTIPYIRSRAALERISARYAHDVRLDDLDGTLALIHVPTGEHIGTLIAPDGGRGGNREVMDAQKVMSAVVYGSDEIEEEDDDDDNYKDGREEGDANSIESVAEKRAASRDYDNPQPGVADEQEQGRRPPGYQSAAGADIEQDDPAAILTALLDDDDASSSRRRQCVPSPCITRLQCGKGCRFCYITHCR